MLKSLDLKMEIGGRQQSIPLASKCCVSTSFLLRLMSRQHHNNHQLIQAFLIVFTHPTPDCSCLFQEDQIVPIMKMFTVLPPVLVSLFGSIQAAPASEAGPPLAKRQVFNLPTQDVVCGKSQRLSPCESLCEISHASSNSSQPLPHTMRHKLELPRREASTSHHLAPSNHVSSFSRALSFWTPTVQSRLSSSITHSIGDPSSCRWLPSHLPQLRGIHVPKLPPRSAAGVSHLDERLDLSLGLSGT
jgi:hypothetical protein